MDEDSKIRRKDPPPIRFDRITPSKKNYYSSSPNMYIHWLGAFDGGLKWKKKKINNPTFSLPYAEQQLRRYNTHPFIFIGAIRSYKGKKQTFPNKTYTFHGTGQFKGEKRTVPVTQQEVEYHIVFYPKREWKKIRNYHHPHKKFQGAPQLFQSLLLTKSTMAKYGLRDYPISSSHMDIRSFKFINVNTIPSFQSQFLIQSDIGDFLDGWVGTDMLIEQAIHYAEQDEGQLHISPYQVKEMLQDDYKKWDLGHMSHTFISEKLVNDYIDWLKKEETNPHIIRYYYIENRDKYTYMMKSLLTSVYLDHLGDFINETIYDLEQ